MTRTFNSNNTSTKTNTIKFLYSYGGQIVPRRTDGELRYVGGYTRVVAVDRSITFAELMVKFGELCGSSMNLKCKLPSEDLDVLVSVTSDEDLANVMEEYDRVSVSTNQEMKIRAVLSQIKSLKKISPPLSPVSVVDFSASKSTLYGVSRLHSLHPKTASAATYKCRGWNPALAVGYPVAVQRDTENVRCNICREGSLRHLYPGHYRNHCQ